MLEAFVLWNEPNNLSHWNFHLDPEWIRFAEMTKLASAAIRRINPNIPIVLGGTSACDADFLSLMSSYGVMNAVDAVGVHGFPLDWNHWQIDAWPERIAEAAAASGKPVWVTEVGASSFGAEEVQLLAWSARSNLSVGLPIAYIGTACMTCRRPGRRKHVTRKPRGQPTIGIIISACFQATEGRNWPLSNSRAMVAWDSANGFILKITGWSKQPRG